MARLSQSLFSMAARETPFDRTMPTTEGDDHIRQFITLRAQLMSTLSCQCKWRGMPELLNELHASRKVIESTGRGQSRRTGAPPVAAIGMASVKRFRASAPLEQGVPEGISW
jgi:hypothetical protein